MIKKEVAIVQSNHMIAKDTFEIVLKNDYISETAKPGQFLHILINGHTLRRPISIANLDPDAKTITILFKIIGSGTNTLQTYQPGMELDVLGPSGNGFKVEPNHSTILLIGGGIGIPPLYYLGKKLVEQRKKVISILGYPSVEHVFYVEKFQALGETIAVTNDGSYDEKGLVTDVLETISSFDCYYSCGPIPMLRALTTKLAHKHGYISLEERMGCGVGSCYACVIPTVDRLGYRKICSDGPVFSTKEVILR